MQRSTSSRAGIQQPRPVSPCQLSKPALLQLQETFPKEMGPILSRSLSSFFFLKPQTDGRTVKIRAKEDRGCRQPAQGIPLPFGVKPFGCVSQETKHNISHTHNVVHHTTNKSLMAGSRKGLMAAMTLPGRQPHGFPDGS